ncbi:hypothetical protein NQ176_g3399 [Zarea fungicola]|uniref:Uncharacterized protein n=1 Tax=Zarea fungicola TaxID=93591 RepID=A0ACC1NK61_9HYPO|nr:hypothetical protein NQ176_g3399 [Lecanicillium fungicola]
MVKSKKKSSSIYQEQPYEEIQESDITEEPEKPQTDDFRAAMPVPNTTTGRQPLDQATRDAFNNNNLSDVTIYISAKSGQIELPAHSFVLAASSTYFKTALEGNFTESKSREFRFHQECPHTYWRVFEYMYTREYSDEPAKNVPFEKDEDEEELSQDVEVFCLAEYFGVDNLKEYALKRFKSKIQELWVSERFIDCIRNVFGSTTKSGGELLRHAVVLAAKDHLSQLWAKQAFKDLVREGGDFTEDLLDMKVASG